MPSLTLPAFGADFGALASFGALAGCKLPPSTLAALQAASVICRFASLSAESLQAAEEPLPALQAASAFARFAALQAGGAGGGPAGPLRFKYNARCKLASDALAGISPTQHCAHPSSHGCSSSLSNGNVLPALFSERA